MARSATQRRPLTPEEIEDSDRLREIYEKERRRRHWSQERFGQQFDIGTQGAVWQYLNRGIPLNVAAALKFARGLNVEVAAFSPRLAKELQGIPIELRDEPAIYTASEPLLSRRPFGVPVVGNVQAGDDGYWHELEKPVGFGEGFVRFESGDPSAYALRVRGDSMRPRIKPGEFIIVEPAADPQPGDEVMVKTKDGRTMVKVLHSRRGGMVELFSINDDHKPITLEVEQIELMHSVSGIMKASSFEPTEIQEGNW